jgi:group II intron reverse transcriptase/maturase
MSLTTPHKVRKLRRALYAKAKAEPEFRFYQLYDKVYREDILQHAYNKCRSKGGAAGVDGETFGAIESRGVEAWLGELAKELKEKCYRAEAVRRVEIPKGNGKMRGLGIPTIRDRVVQTAAVLVLEPIFEADLPDEQYAYRPKRGALEAIKRVHRTVSRGHTEVVDADLSAYFDTIPHGQLMKSVARRVVDRQMLKLIKQWIEAPIEEDDGRGGKRRTARARRERRGVPQGAPISPLLANLYMRRFILAWKRSGLRDRLGAEIVNYADDFVICCRPGTGAQALAWTHRLMDRLGLEVNAEKTRLCRLPEEHFTFLGYEIGRCYSRQTGRAYLGTRPSKKSIRRLTASLSDLTHRRTGLLDVETIVARMNRKLRGWGAYFCLGPVSPAYRAVDRHALKRLRQWLCRKHKVRGQGSKRSPDAYLSEKLGLLHLGPTTRNLPWAKA